MHRWIGGCLRRGLGADDAFTIRRCELLSTAALDRILDGKSLWPGLKPIGVSPIATATDSAAWARCPSRLQSLSSLAGALMRAHAAVA